MRQPDMRQRDPVEADYERGIAQAAACGDNDTTQDLVIGLRQYRELYKTSPHHLEENR